MVSQNQRRSFGFLALNSTERVNEANTVVTMRTRIIPAWFVIARWSAFVRQNRNIKAPGLLQAPSLELPRENQNAEC